MIRERLSRLYGKGPSSGERHRMLRRNLVVIMVLLVIAPLVVVTGLSLYRYNSLLEDEVNTHARLSTESARQTIEAFLDKLKAAIQVTADSYTYEYLSSGNNIDAVFRRLKNKHPGLVDLSVIGHDGIQTAYSGPYKLKGKDYADSEWYRNAITKDSHISEVFMGYRAVPHFVIAISKKMPDGSGNWLVRASVDTETLDRYLEPIRSEVVTDAFLIDHNGVLQSGSKHHGGPSSPFALPDLTVTKRISMAEGMRSGSEVLRTFVEIKDSPWILVLESKALSGRKTWRSFNSQMFFIFLACTALAVVIAVKVAHHLADSIQEAEDMRGLMLAETEHTNKLASIGRLAAGVAHEINNPLAIINEKAGLMKDLLKLSEDFKYKEKFSLELDSLQNAVTRSHTITHRLLGFARRMEVKREAVKVNDVIDDVISFLEKDALHNNVRIVRDTDPALPDVTGDRGQMQQIFLNIINNAIDAAGRGGLVRIASRGQGPGAIAVDVYDNGPGIPPEARKHLFEPFFTTKMGKEKPGTGLGLFITFGLLKKMGGDIAIESSLESGTTFKITLPVSTLKEE